MSAEQSRVDEVELFGRRLELYDLSDTLSNSTSEHEPNPHQIEYMDHLATLPIAAQLFGLEAQHFRNGLSWAYERVELTTHSGTHVDAPWHYAPDAPGGKRAMTIDEIPLSWFVGRGVVLDFHELDPQLGATDADVQRALAEAGHELRPGDVVLIRTDASEHFSEPGYEHYGCGLRRSATEWLVDNGVRLIGIDAYTLDRPVPLMAEEAKEGAHDQFWESHYLGAEKPYCHIERLAGLAGLPSPTGFYVVALPFRIEAASAGWARVVAIYDKGAV